MKIVDFLRVQERQLSAGILIYKHFDSCYTLTDYQIRIETGKNMWFL